MRSGLLRKDEKKNSIFSEPYKAIYTNDAKGDTALMLAASQGKKDIVQDILKTSADINAANRLGYTALIYSAANGHDEIVKMLLAAGANKNIKNNLGNTALSAAILCGKTRCILPLLGGEEINQLNDAKDTLLMTAAKVGNADAIMLLLNQGANSVLNYQNKDGCTALMMAVMRGDDDSVSVLLKAGADSEICDDYGNRALDYALSRNDSKTAALLRKQGAFKSVASVSKDILFFKPAAKGEDKLVEDAILQLKKSFN